MIYLLSDKEYKYTPGDVRDCLRNNNSFLKNWRQDGVLFSDHLLAVSEEADVNPFLALAVIQLSSGMVKRSRVPSPKLLKRAVEPRAMRTLYGKSLHTQVSMLIDQMRVLFEEPFSQEPIRLSDGVYVYKNRASKALLILMGTLGNDYPPFSDWSTKSLIYVYRGFKRYS